MIEPAIRLRRSIRLADLVLVQHLIEKHPAIIRNPDPTDNNNSSLHLAAILGHVEIAEFLIDAGHEAACISRSADGRTPLMAAVAAGQDAAAETLLARFPHALGWRAADGRDALMLAARGGRTALVQLLLATAAAVPAALARPPRAAPLATLQPAPDPRALLAAADEDGNTALHFAAAFGHLKPLRVLLAAGADATVPNEQGATPIAVSRSRSAMDYFVNMVMEVEKRKGEEREMARRRAGEGGIRTVPPMEIDDDEDAASIAETIKVGPTGLRKPGQGQRSRAGTDD